MNSENRNAERYSHCLCFNVKPVTLFIGFYFFITSASTIIRLSSGYPDFRQHYPAEEDTRRAMTSHRPTATLLLMVNLMVAIVSAMLIYGVTKSKASYLMPFFGIQLYHFLFSLPSALQNLNLSAHQYPRSSPFSTSPVTSPSDARSMMRPGDADNTAYTFGVLTTLGDFLLDIYFICVVWKCYHYLKMKEISTALSLPYNLDFDIVMPSEVVSTSTVAPPDYETAIKANPPPDYESAIKNPAPYPIPMAPSPGINSSPPPPPLPTPPPPPPPSTFITIPSNASNNPF
ncbi:lysosomal-associated transmembrane protein 4B-like [Brevipalpus obovatus]|uniref:lysosomal-associated transmembrane protein 4B-like n=1 Tax=Brevipalpus obovatus TaxID=246614 RepID=UPI003D9F84EC